MPPKRKKSKQIKNSSGGTKKSDVFPDSSSLFVGFVDGLQVTSSPGLEISSGDERKRILLKASEEHRRISEDAINLRFGAIIAALEEHELSRTAVWEGRDLMEVTQSLLDEAAKADQMYDVCYGSYVTDSRKVTWASGTHQKPSRPTRVLRRSRSVEPRCTPGQPENRSHRFSLGRSYPELRTPSVTRNFHYNIATVTPHPNQTSSVSIPSILRKPKFGETAISMSGSPLLVSSDHVSGPSIVVPLADGRVFNVQGNTLSVREQLREGLDHTTIVQLKEIKDFINNLVP